jgi:hypothetical protein
MQTAVKFICYVSVFVIITFFAILSFVHFSMIRPMRLQMHYGHEFLDSLSYEKVTQLTEWAEITLNTHPEATYYTELPVPEELLGVNILRIVKSSPRGIYISWLGGVDHTGLQLEQDEVSGKFKVYSIYSEEDKRLIYDEGTWKK